MKLALPPRSSAVFAFAFAFALAIVCGFGCGGGAEPPKTAAKTTSNEPKPPRCPPSEDDHPSDAKVRMADLQADIRKCYTLGTPGKTGGSIQLEVQVHESGSVKGAKVLEGAGGHPSAVVCTENAAKKIRFAKFCGEDVSIRWSYALQ